jgi:hypothetical protein
VHYFEFYARIRAFNASTEFEGSTPGHSRILCADRRPSAIHVHTTIAIYDEASRALVGGNRPLTSRDMLTRPRRHHCGVFKLTWPKRVEPKQPRFKWRIVGFVALVPKLIEPWAAVAKVAANSIFAKLATLKLEKKFTCKHKTKFDQERVERFSNAVVFEARSGANKVADNVGPSKVTARVIFIARMHCIAYRAIHTMVACAFFAISARQFIDRERLVAV